MRERRSGKPLAAVVVSLWLIAACGGSTSTPATSTPATSTPATSTPATAGPRGSSPPGAAPAAAAPAPAVLRDVIERAAWADTVSLELGERTWRFRGRGLGDHPRAERYAMPNDGVAVPTAATAHAEPDPSKPQDYDIEITLEPKLAGTPTKVSAGPVGIIISDALEYNPYEADGTTVAMLSNFTVDGAPFVDDCHGHPVPFLDLYQYHYHGVPVCVASRIDRPGEHAHLIGVAFDGFPMYADQDVGGAAPTDLDECGGHIGPTPEVPGGMYHYHLTATEPFTMTCLMGVVDLQKALEGAFRSADVNAAAAVARTISGDAGCHRSGLDLVTESARNPSARVTRTRGS